MYPERKADAAARIYRKSIGSDKTPGVAATAITAVAIVSFTNALYDIIKAGVQATKPEAPPATPDEVDIIQIEWADIRLPKKSYDIVGRIESCVEDAGTTTRHS